MKLRVSLHKSANIIAEKLTNAVVHRYATQLRKFDIVDAECVLNSIVNK